MKINKLFINHKQSLVIQNSTNITLNFRNQIVNLSRFSLSTNINTTWKHINGGCFNGKPYELFSVTVIDIHYV